jgi:hypothetical protein
MCWLSYLKSDLPNKNAKGYYLKDYYSNGWHLLGLFKDNTRVANIRTTNTSNKEVGL